MPDSSAALSNGDIAPVALLVFNRPRLTARVYERIRAARPKRLLIVADGPRPNRPEDAELCRETRRIVSSPDWPCELMMNVSDVNLGCRRRVSSGLDWVFHECSEALILEDDCLPCGSFFEFASTMLRHYRDDTRVMHVSGDNFQNGRLRGDGSYYFSRYPLTFGWATWRRAWRHYDVDMAMWPTAYRERWLDSILDDPAEVRYWTAKFDGVYRGHIDTWDYQWLFTCWSQSGLSVLPNRNLVTNIGWGEDATHFREEHSTLGIPTQALDDCCRHPSSVIRHKEADRFTYTMHIAERPRLAGLTGLSRLRARLSIRSRVRRLLPHSLQYRY